VTLVRARNSAHLMGGVTALYEPAWYVQRMEPDPLLQRLDTVLPEDREQLAFVPTELPSSIEDIMAALMKQPGIEGVSLGRQVISFPCSSFLTCDVWGRKGGGSKLGNADLRGGPRCSLKQEAIGKGGGLTAGSLVLPHA